MTLPINLFHRILHLLLGVFLLNPQSLHADTNSYPSFQEILQTMKRNIPSGSVQEWEKLAIDGLFSRLDGKVILIPPQNDESTNATQKPLTCPQLFDGSFAYLRLLNIEKGIGEQVRLSLNQLNQTNTIKGLIFDFRFANGTEYPEIKQLMDPFINKEVVLLKSGNQIWKSLNKTNAFSFPLVALINRQTRGAAEALAGVMQHSKLALLIGTTTSGKALGYSEIPLSQGFMLKIAQEPLHFADGTNLSNKGVAPDIRVSTSIEVDWQSFTNAFPNEMKPVITGTQSTNLSTGRSKINEAQLVRMQKEGKSLQDLQATNNTRFTELMEAPMRDQVLARALDVLKAIYAIQPKSR